MKIEDTTIEGLKLIHLKEFRDERGIFFKVFNEQFFAENSLETNFKESYYSVSLKNVIRGMHFQTPPAEHTKLVYVNKGSVLDVCLDIRRYSSTYGQFFKTILSEKNPTMVYIPTGFAHGFLSLEDFTIITYLQSSCYDSAFDTGIKFDSFGMDWEIKNPILSQRDSNFPKFNSHKSIF